MNITAADYHAAPITKSSKFSFFRLAEGDQTGGFIAGVANGRGDAADIH